MDISPLWISLKTTLCATFLAFVFGIVTAWLMSCYKGRFKGMLDGILTLPLVVPPTVVGFFLLLLFGKNGPVGKLLMSMGTTIIFTWGATVISSGIVAFPLMYRTCRSSFEQIDSNLINAGRTLGLTEFKIFYSVLIPLAWPGIVAGTILAFARSLGEFGATLMIAGNIPGKTQTIPLAIYFAAESGKMDQAFLWVITVCGISLTVIILMNYWEEIHKKRLAYNRREHKWGYMLTSKRD
ncbi:MAG: molybdate ABC transporter permease subunit [Eubacteriaceae bacterium]